MAPIERLTLEDIALLKAATEGMWERAEKAMIGRKPRFGQREKMLQRLTSKPTAKERLLNHLNGVSKK